MRRATAIEECRSFDGGPYEVIEMERSGAPQEAINGFVGGDTAAAFDGLTTKLGYDPEEGKQGIAGQYGGNGGVVHRRMFASSGSSKS